MRRMVIGLGLWLAAVPLWAANPGSSTPRPAPELRTHAQSLATQILAVSQYIEGNYVRHVTQAAMVRAAVTGWFEAAREPFPPSLHADLTLARNSDDYRAIIAEARERFGDAPSVSGGKDLTIALVSMARALDPYSGLPSRNDARREIGSYVGIGVELEAEANRRVTLDPNFIDPLDSRVSQPFANRRGPVRFTDIYPGGPAQRAGLKPADLLTHIDGQELRGPETPKLLQRLTQPGREGSKGVKLTLRRPGRAEPVEVEVVPTQFTPENVFGVQRRVDQTWNYMLDASRKIGYVRLGFIDQPAVEEMEAALAELTSASIRGLIFDLRDCPGGYVDPAVLICGYFIKTGTVAVVRSKGEEEKRHTTGDKPIVAGIPIIVLVNRDTMGGGEMIAAALQDHHIAAVAGQRTFGKGSVQNTPTIPAAGISFKLTTGMFTRPNGKNLHRFPDSKLEDDWGVRPDLPMPTTPELNSQLREWMHLQALRPGNNRELLPLDDPDNDPLRQFALRELLKRVK